MSRFSSAIFCLLLSVILSGCGTGVNLPTGRRMRDEAEEPAAPVAKKSASEDVAVAPPKPTPPAPTPETKPVAAATAKAAPETTSTKPENPSPPANSVASATTPAPNPASAPAATLPTVAGPVKQAPLPPPSSIKLETNVPPTASDAQLTEQTALRMKRILFALDAYSNKNGHYPPAIILNDKGEPLYSWRVELLPYLGYEELYALFDKALPWNDPKNLTLIKSIPLEFQSPYRENDGKTTFFAAKGRGCAFQGLTPVKRDQFLDGFDQTVLLVEADDPMAQPWTCPRDYDYRRSSPGARLGKLRQGGFLSGFADGEIRRVETTLPKEKMRAIFTIAGNENITPRAVSKPWDDVVTRATQVASVDLPTGSLFPEIEGATASFSQEDVAETFENRLPVPVAAEIERARKELKSMFSEELAKATNASKLGDFAKQMLDDADKYKADPPAYYAILVAVRDTAAKQGDYPVTLKATTKMLEAFRVDSLLERRKMLESLGERIKKESLDEFRKDTEEIVEQAIAGDDYKTAAVASDALVKATRRALAKEREPSSSSSSTEGGKKKPKVKVDDPSLVEIKRVTRLHEDVLERKRSFDKVAAAKEALKQNPDDPQANQDLGEYLCLHKGDWNGGLPFLAKSADLKIKLMTGIDVAIPRDPQQMLDLGDLYWDMGEKKDNLPQMWLWLRAIYWYRQSVAAVPPTLARARAEKRMQQAITTYGAATVEKHLKTMTQAPSALAKLVSTGTTAPQ
jgi:hypothetical protein